MANSRDSSYFQWRCSNENPLLFCLVALALLLATPLSAQTVIPRSTTTNFGLIKPETISGTWGADINANFDTIDTNLAAPTLSGNLKWKSGTSFTGELDHSITANRVWILPDLAGTIVLREGTETLSGDKTFSATLSATGTLDASGVLRIPRKVDPASPVASELWDNTGIIKIRANLGTPANRTFSLLEAAETFSGDKTFTGQLDGGTVGTLRIPRKADPASPVTGECWVNVGSIKCRDNAATPATREFVTLDAAQTLTGNKTFTGSLLADGATSTLPVKALTSFPATCVANKELLIRTDVAPAGQQLYLCNSAGNNWNKVGDGNPGTPSLQTVADIGRSVTNATSTNPVVLGDGTREMLFYGDATDGPVFVCRVSGTVGNCNIVYKLNANFFWAVRNSAGTNFLRIFPEPTTVASTEAVDFDFANNRTLNFPTGALATQRFTLFRQPTISFSGASTCTDCATVGIIGAPIAGTNATITNPWALRIEGGNVRFASTRFDIGNVVYNWPAAQGAANQLLQNDGSGNLSYADRHRVIARQVTVQDVVNTVTETTVFTTTIAGGTLGTNKQLRVIFSGDFLNNTAGGQTLRVKATYGGTVFFDGTSASIALHANRKAMPSGRFVISAANATGSQVTEGQFCIGPSTSAVGVAAEALSCPTSVHNSVAIDSTVNQTLAVTFTNSAADVNLSSRLLSIFVESLP